MNHEYDTAPVLTKTFEGTTHDEITAEYNLPDYLPDVSRLLNIRATVTESSHALAGDTVEYDGKVKYAILYATGDGILKHAEFDREFSGTAAVSGTAGDCDIRFDPHIEAVSCRLQNPRKLTAKVKLTPSTTVLCKTNVTPTVTGKLSAEDERTLEARTHSIVGVCITSAEEKNTPVSEDIELESHLPVIEEIVSAEMDPYLLDLRAGENKVIYKGEILATILYKAAPDEETPAGTAPRFCSFAAKIPISGEIPTEGISEKYIPFGSVLVSTPEFRPQTNAFGENRTVELDFDYSVSVTLFGNRESILTTDMYSTAYESTAECETISYESVLGAKSFNFTSEGSASLDDPDFDAVIMTTAAASVERTEKAGGKLLFFGTALVSCVLTNGEGIYLTKNFEIPFRAEADGSALSEEHSLRITPAVLSVSAKCEGETLSAGLEILISYIAFEKHTERRVLRLAVSKDAPIEHHRDASLVLCYPAPADTLWDVAKKYRTTTLSLMEANGITAETAPRVLIIPRYTGAEKNGYRLI